MKTLEELVKIPLSLEQVQRYLPHTKVCLYSDFANMKTLPAATVYLFLTSDNFGHFCCVLRKGTEVEFFDSYGLAPEMEHAFVSKEMLRHLHENHNYILDFCKRKGWKVTYSKARLQGKDAETCGRFCVERVRKQAMSAGEFAHWMMIVASDAGVTPDYVVSYLVS